MNKNQIHTHVHSELSEMEIRVCALESALSEKSSTDPAALDVLVDTYRTKIGPGNAARVVARAWIDSTFRDWPLSDATAAKAK